jgi:hypothetical protein
MLHICRHCHRIQEARVCGECGRTDFTAWPGELTLFRRKEAVGVGVGENPEGWGCLGLMLAAGVVVTCGVVGAWLLEGLGGRDGSGIGLMVGMLLGGGGAYGMQFLRLRMKRQSRLQPRIVLALPPARDEKQGTARPHQPSIPSLLTGTPCLASAIVAERISDGKVVLERVEAGSFWLDAEGEPILVCGEMKLVGDGKVVPASSIAGRRALALGDLKVPELAEIRLREIAILPGAPVTVAGTVSHEEVPDLGYRGGTAPVMRGMPGAPVVVEIR